LSLSNTNKLFLALAILWMLTIFWLSSSADAQGLDGFLAWLPFKDKIAHAGIFGLLAILLRLAGFTFWQALVLSSFYGFSDELHQHFVAGRSRDIFDWLAGTLWGAIILRLLNFFTIGNTSLKKR